MTIFAMMEEMGIIQAGGNSVMSSPNGKDDIIFYRDSLKKEGKSSLTVNL